jgi:hypothetical protein
MCFFSAVDYACGDWKWGTMREQCRWERRIGEHCGTKLLHHETSVRSDQPCSTCIAIATKYRRIAKHQEALKWRRQQNTAFQHNIAKAELEIQDLRDEIAQLEAKRSSVQLVKSKKVVRADVAGRIVDQARFGRHSTMMV